MNKLNEQQYEIIEKSIITTTDGAYYARSDAVAIKNNEYCDNDIWRSNCEHFIAEGNSGSIPVIKTIDNENMNSKNLSESQSAIKIDLTTSSVTLCVPRNFTTSVQNGEQHIKSNLLSAILVKQNKQFAEKFLSNKGKMTLVNHEANIQIVQLLRSMLSKLESQYLNNAIFMMSSAVYAALMSSKNKQGIYYNYDHKFCGYKIVIENNLSNNIIFGNFKSGAIIGDGKDTQIETMTDVKFPQYVFHNLVSRSEIGVIEEKAFVYAEYKSENDADSSANA